MRQPTSTLARLLAALFAVVAAVIAMPEIAAAHTDFDSSSPADGESVADPVGEITVVFTLPVTLVGNGFEVLDPQGNIVEPTVTTDDDTGFTLQLDRPLAGGDVGVRYEVTAEDGHVLSGGFSFTVTAPAPAVDAPPVTEPPVTEPPVTEPPASAAPSASAAPAIETPAAPVVTEAPASAPAGAVDEAAAGAGSGADDDGGTSTGVYLAIAAAVAVAAGAFSVLRSRTSAGG